MPRWSLYSRFAAAAGGNHGLSSLVLPNTKAALAAAFCDLVQDLLEECENPWAGWPYRILIGESNVSKEVAFAGAVFAIISMAMTMWCRINASASRDDMQQTSLSTHKHAMSQRNIEQFLAYQNVYLDTNSNNDNFSYLAGQ